MSNGNDPAAPTAPEALTPSPPLVPAPLPLCPVVAIGASAGGLAAFESFFAGLSVAGEPGLALVLVQHLAPDHKSLLPELIQRFTPLPVHEAHDGMALQANHVYTMPPNVDMALFNGTLQLLAPVTRRGLRLPIDHFFASLAQDRGSQAIGIVLSGTGSDGTAGVRAIKTAGGMVLVQTPQSSEFDGMPASAIATGVVDHTVTPFDMAALLSGAARPQVVMAADERTAGPGGLPATERPPLNPAALQKIFVLLRARTGHDFSQYKLGTIARRIERRMAVHHLSLADDYVKYLQQTPAEVQALFEDFLIGVTHFFRDTEAFDALQAHIQSKLLHNRPMEAGLRVWTPGCSTGEEAYSLAILLAEQMAAQQQSFSVQIFATDIDSRAIATARVGRYPSSISADVSPQRLARFFTAEPQGGGYRIHKSVRDMVIFSEQNVLKDPPFSRLDLLSCRNLLIYFGAELQHKLIPLFHYALQPGGLLFLGTSEGVGDTMDLFNTIDRKAKLYQRISPAGSKARFTPSLYFPPLARSAIAPDLADTPLPPSTGRPTVKPSLRELTEQALLNHMAVAAVLVTPLGDILYLQGRSGLYLELHPGEPGTSNVLRMARNGLRTALTQALQRAHTTQLSVQVPRLMVQTNGHRTAVDLTVLRVRTGSAPSRQGAVTTDGVEPLYLVILEEAKGQRVSVADRTPQRSTDAPLDAQGQAPTEGHDDGSNATQSGARADAAALAAQARIEELTTELQAKEEYIQSTHEELESANEELKSSNEEMQSVNEELQSTNEEMETSKEELQSLNEELATVNNELHIKVQDLSRANNDMNNLLAGTGIATVFLDSQLRILRFTPTASALINLIDGDVGRPVAHIVSNLVDYDHLVADAKGVLDTLQPLETQVQTLAGRWFTLRARPYRTLENVIEGVVITFEDITGLKQIQDELSRLKELARLAVVVRDAHDAITVQDLDGSTLAWNPGAVRIYGWTEAEALAMNIRARIPPGKYEDSLDKLLQLSQAEVLVPYATQRLCSDGRTIDVWITSTALINDSGDMYAVATTERTRRS